MSRTPANRILDAWIQLEETLRQALPVCSVAPPTQPAELLSALRINHRIREDDEARVLALRQVRNRAAHALDEPPEEEASEFEAEVAALRALVSGGPSDAC